MGYTTGKGREQYLVGGAEHRRLRDYAPYKKALFFKKKRNGCHLIHIYVPPTGGWMDGYSKCWGSSCNGNSVGSLFGVSNCYWIFIQQMAPLNTRLYKRGRSLIPASSHPIKSRPEQTMAG